MKFILYALLILFIFPTKLFSQTGFTPNKIIYLDSIFIESTEENCRYIRIIEDYYSERKSYVYKDYYKSKAIKSIGTTLNKDFINPEGQFMTYYENGNKKSITTFANNKIVGKVFNWYENGDQKSEIEYFENKKGNTEYKINNYWSREKKQIVKDGNGEYIVMEKHFEERGRIQNGFEEGEFKGIDLKNKSTFIEIYKKGKLISGITTDSLNIKHYYTQVEQPPGPKIGLHSFHSYIERRMDIPAQIRKKVFGKIYLTFKVDEEGNLIEPKVVKGLGYGLDENAIKAIKGVKKWNPAIIRGIPVPVLYSLPITITKSGL